jgi:hypothetical protein
VCVALKDFAEEFYQESSYLLKVRKYLKAFTVTALNKFFLDNRLCQLWIKAQSIGDHLCFHRQWKGVGDR